MHNYIKFGIGIILTNKTELYIELDVSILVIYNLKVYEKRCIVVYLALDFHKLKVKSKIFRSSSH